jgi:hypothetical protein
MVRGRVEHAFHEKEEGVTKGCDSHAKTSIALSRAEPCVT